MTDLQVARETLSAIVRCNDAEIYDRAVAADTLVTEHRSRMNRRLAMLIAIGTWVIMAVIVALCFTGCVHLPHVDAKPRPMSTRLASVVRVDSFCNENDPFALPNQAGYTHDGKLNFTGGSGSGVVIDERHVLTAYHVIGCPVVAIVHVVLSDGRNFRMYVDKEDPEHDMARLVIASAENFGLNIPPPTRGPIPKYGDAICTAVAYPLLGGACGTVSTVNDPYSTKHLPAPFDAILFGDIGVTSLIVSGNSGGPVYDVGGNLIGLVVEGTVPPVIGGRIRALGDLHADWFAK